MEFDTALTLLGVFVTVIAGYLVYRIQKNVKQRQKVGRGGIGIQSGRDTRLGQTNGKSETED